MENLEIKGDNKIPTVIMNTNGEIKITGRAIVEDAAKFFSPILNWASSCNINDVSIEINLEYFNTSVSKQLLNLFRAFEKNSNTSKVTVTWMYEIGDDEMLESGEIYEELLPDFEFIYKKYAEVIE